MKASQRHENAVRVARALIAAKKEAADLRVELTMEKLATAQLKNEVGALKFQLATALHKIHAPQIDGHDMPGDLKIADLADLAMEIGCRARPSLEPLPPASGTGSEP